MTVNAANPATHPVDWGMTVRGDFYDVILGEHLGGGVGRNVYACKLRDDLVIKVEDRARSFQNIEEWNAWHDVDGTKWSKWFAPCHSISACGSVLLQSRTRPIDKLPKRLPTIFTDIKPENFGSIDGRVVCHDYGYNRLARMGVNAARMASFNEGEQWP